jgi:hypothetical protein
VSGRRCMPVLLALCPLFLAVTSCAPGGPGDTGPLPVTHGTYSVFAWNELGMHCLNPTYDQLVILPPYNNLSAQVVKRGAPPEVVTAAEIPGLTVEYRVVGNTFSYGKRGFGKFWDNALALFGVDLTASHDVGLTGNGLSGAMTEQSGYFLADGIPVVPVDDAGTWNPYQVAEVTVKLSGSVVAQTRATIPTSDEINCGTCHGTPGDTTSVFNDIISKHDAAEATNLAGSMPFKCADCHPSPALGIMTGSAVWLSQAIHGFHGSLSNVNPSPACYDCHPGTQTKCSRSTRHTASDGNCTDCHGTIANVASTIVNNGRVPWASEPKCLTCHGGVAEVDTGTTLYRNASGHHGMFCAACHGSPHAQAPTNDVGSFTNWDGYQSQQYQGYSTRVKSIGSCGVCHDSSRGEGSSEFAEAHGGPNPEQENGCYACHTAVPSSTVDWPHSFQWRNSN